MTIDRTADLFHDLLIKPEIERAQREEKRVTVRITMPVAELDPIARYHIAAPYQPHSPTSRAAAELALPRAGTQRRRVYDFLVGCGPRGATDDEMQARIPMNPSTQRPRRIELWRAKLIRQANFRDDSIDQVKPSLSSPLVGPDFSMVRKTASGRDAVVWVAV